MGLALSAHRRILLLRILNGLGILFLLVMHDITSPPSGLLTRLDLFFYDARYEHAPTQVDPRVVIVDIDERSLARTGRWPWTNERLAQLNERIFQEGRPAVVGYSLFPSAAGADASGESAFAASIAGRPVVLGYYLGTGERGVSSGQLPRPLFPPDGVSALGDAPIEATGYRANSERLASVASQGFLNAFPGAGIDQDGTLRGLPLLARLEQGVQESFAIAVLRRYLSATAATATARTLGLHADDSSLGIPVSDGYSAMIPFSQGSGPGSGRFVWISAVDLLDGWVDASVLRDRIVLVGSSAQGLSDARPTPGSISTPSVEIQASLIAGALDESIPRRMAAASLITALILLLAGGSLAVLLPRIEPVPALAASSAVLLLLAAVNSVIDQVFGLVLPLAASLFAIVLILVFNLIFGYLVEGRSRGAVVRLFSEYLSPTLVEQMSTDPERWRSGEITNRELTILFADIRGFTRMAESMEPAVLRDYLNKVLTGMTAVVHHHGGTVDKYIGDAIMAFWGAPIDDPRHADRAVDAAIAMQQEVRRLSADFVVSGLPPLAIGIGVNSGLVQVGDMGSAARRTYTAIGDAVNLASRLESLTKRYEVPIIIGESTVAACVDHLFDELGPAMVDGRSEPVRVFSPHFGPNAWIERTFGSLWRRRVPGRRQTGGERRTDREDAQEAGR